MAFISGFGHPEKKAIILWHWTLLYSKRSNVLSSRGTKKMRRQQWSDDMIAFAIKTFKAGYSMSQVTSELNKAFGTSFTRNALIGKLHRSGIGENDRLIRPKEGRLPKPKADKAKARMRFVPSLPLAPQLKEVASETASEFWCDIAELNTNRCKWPHGNVMPYKFCGANVEGKGSWCSYHHKIVYDREAEYAKAKA
jgi:hypothetical protein